MEGEEGDGGGSLLLRLPAALLQHIHDIMKYDRERTGYYDHPIKPLLRLCCHGIKAAVDGLGWARLEARCAHGRRSRS
jgi:hypothetical protein